MIDMFKSLAEQNRLDIVKLLSKKSLCVCEIEKKIGKYQNLVSHHLSVLKKLKIIENCRCGKKNYYSLDKQALKKIINKINE